MEVNPVVCVCACKLLHLEATIFTINVFPLCVSIGGYGSFQDVITLASKMILGYTFPWNVGPHTQQVLSALTPPDIIKLFNPKLLGAAPGKTVHGMQAHISETGFNLAVTGHNTL